MNRFREKGFSIFSRLLIAFLGIVMLMSGVLTAVFYVYSRKSLEKQTQERVLQQFEAISYHFRYELRDALVKDLLLLASNPILDEFISAPPSGRKAATRAVERLFLTSLKFSRSYERIAFISATGKEAVKVDWSGRIRTYRQVGSRPLFARIKSGQAGSIDIEGPFTDQFGNVVFSTGIHKISTELGTFKGVVVIDYNLKDFHDYLDRITMSGKNPVWLFTPDGALLKQPNDKNAFFDPRLHVANGFFKSPQIARADGGMVVYEDLYINPDRPLLRLVVSIPSSLLLRDMKSVLRFFLIVSALSLLVVSAAAYFLAGYLSRPIVGLARAASAFAKGDNSRRIAAETNDEVRLLIDSFKRMTEDLEKTTVSRDYVDNIINNMMDTLIVASRDGKIMRANAAACVLLGYDEKELIGRPIETIIAEKPENAPDLGDFFTQHSIFSGELFYQSKDGGRLPMLFSSSVMYDGRHNVLGIVCVAQDISERKRTEAQIKSYSEELQVINEELKNFVYIVSHDLRSPLVNIKGFSEELILGIREIGPLLEKYLDGFEDEERRKFSEILKKDIPEALTFIGSSVNRMDNLINAVLKLSRVGRRKLNPEPVSAQDLVRTVLHSLAHQIESHQISVKLHDLPDVVADRTALEQIFGNLIDNAVKYRDPARAGEITISGERTRDEALFLVRDNGRGMAKEDIPKAFELFRRVGQQDVPGEGMGLAYVKTLVRLHGGRIWCDSEPGVGTLFTFTLHQPEDSAGAFPQQET